MRRLLIITTLLIAPMLSAQPRPPLTRALADALYCRLTVGCVGFNGTVTSVSVVTANGFSGTVATATTTPAITLTCALCLTSGGALGTPSSGTGANLTGIPESGVTNLTTDLAGKQATGNYITALSGNVVASGPGSVAATIQPGVVTLAMQANMATASLVYRKTAGSGAPEVNTLATLKTDLLLTGTNSGDQTITGGTCTNQFVSAISASVVPTCTSVLSAALNITTTACTNQFVSAISSGAVGTCSTLALAGFPTMANNTVLANATSGTAVPTALAVSTCSGASNALNWTTNIGFGCNGSITANTATTATTATNQSGGTVAATTATATTFKQTGSAADTGYMLANSGNLASTTALNPGLALFGGDGVNSLYAVDLGYNNSRYRVRVMSGGSGSDVAIGAAAATPPTLQSQFTESLTVRGDNGRVGVNNTAPSKTLDVTGTLAVSGAITPSSTAGIVGTTTNDNANAGSFGEYQTGTVAANTTSLSTGTTINVGTNTNITLTAGDWDCSGVVNFTFGATTSITNLTGGISTTTGTLPAQDSYFDYETSAVIPTGTAVATWVVPTVRLSNSGSTNVFLVSQATFTASTIKVGGTIRCRRMR